MKQYKVRKFSHEARKEKVRDAVLLDTLNDFLNIGTHGQLKFALGGGLYKLRVASKEGRGKSGGSRSILAFKNNSRVIWLHLFAKNDKGNVTISDLKKLKILSNILLNLSEDEIARLIDMGELCEVNENV